MATSEPVPQPMSSPFSFTVDCRPSTKLRQTSRERAGSSPKVPEKRCQRGSEATSVWGPRKVVTPMWRMSAAMPAPARLATAGSKVAARARLPGQLVQFLPLRGSEEKFTGILLPEAST